VVAPQQQDELVEALAEICGNPARVAEIAAENAKLVRQAFTADAIAEGLYHSHHMDRPSPRGVVGKASA
jgi:hypothetical protein